MRKSLLAIAAMALVAAPALAGPGKYNKVVAPGDKAPTFSGLPAVMGDQEASISIDDIKEDVVVLVFLANHCPYVTMVEDRLIDLVHDYKDKNVRVVAVCVTPARSGPRRGCSSRRQGRTGCRWPRARPLPRSRNGRCRRPGRRSPRTPSPQPGRRR